RDAEKTLLERHGHEVVVYRRESREIDDFSALRKARLALDVVWSRDSDAEVAALVDREQPDLAHVHSIYPMISPSVYGTPALAGVPIVQTLHDYRFFCIESHLLRKGRVCEECPDHGVWRGVLHKCYRDSRVQSFAMAQSLWIHGLLRTMPRR